MKSGVSAQRVTAWLTCDVVSLSYVTPYTGGAYVITNTQNHAEVIPEQGASKIVKKIS